MRSPRLRSLPTICAALALLGACNDRTTPPEPIVASIGDAGAVEGDTSFDRPVRGLCVPGSRRCVAENSPMVEVCGRLGSVYRADACDDGEVCRDGECVPFSCVPGRPLCVGATTRATCDATGTAIEQPGDCDDPQVCLGGACVDPCEQARLSSSYIACEYSAHDMPNLYKELSTERKAPFGVVVANPAPLVDATVSITDGLNEATLVEPFVLEPSASYSLGEETELQSELLLPDGTTSLIEESTDVSVPAGAAAVFLLRGSGSYDITASRPVVAYQFSPYCCNFTATNDASLLLPTSTWGTRYRVLGYPAWPVDDEQDYLQAYISITSPIDTTATVTSPVPLKVIGEFEAATETTLDLRAGTPVILETVAGSSDAGDEATDLSGTVVEAEEPVSVFTGHPCTFVPQDKWACDHLEESVLPSSVLGSRYVLTPVRERFDRSDPNFRNDDVTEATYWRVLADEDATITFDPPLADLTILPPSNDATPDCRDLSDGDTLTLAAGEVCEFGSNEPTTADSTGALVIGGVISGHQSTGVSGYGTQAGDPSLFILPPVEQFRTDYDFVSAPTFKRGYVTVAAPPSAPVALDGTAVSEEQRLERRVVTLGNTEWEVFTIAVESGVHSLESENKFGIVVYAYDDYVSYAFTGGLDLLPKDAQR